MDTDISGWILEFLITQNNLDDETLDDLINILPIPNNNPNLKKRLLLRQLEYDIQTDTISEQTIDLLEHILELDTTELSLTVSEVPETMKTAYCTVMMYRTIKSIGESKVGDNMNESYGNAVRRACSDRIREMEKCCEGGGGGVVREEVLLRWVRDVEAKILDDDVCENVLDLDVLAVVRRYVNEAKEKMGPSFVEVACGMVLSDRGLCKDMGLDGGVPGMEKDGDGSSEGNEAMRARVLPRNKQGSPTRPGKSRQKTHRGAKIVDPMETNDNRYDAIPTPVVNKVKEALDKSSFELRAAVKDPLPDALRYAESLNVNKSGENMGWDHDAGGSIRVNDEAPSSSHDRKGKALETDGDDGLGGNQHERPRPSLMERNNTAHTVEWSDSIDDSDEGSPTRPHLPTPKKRRVSPLSIYNINKLARQRKKRRWTVVEEDTLRNGVQKYGKGNWKLILSMYRDNFEDRTEVDLKDKWRNLTR